MDLMNESVKRFKLLATQLKITYEDLSEITGIPISRLKKIMSGALQMNLNERDAILIALHEVECNYLEGGKKENGHILSGYAIFDIYTRMDPLDQEAVSLWFKSIQSKSRQIALLLNKLSESLKQSN